LQYALHLISQSTRNVVIRKWLGYEHERKPHVLSCPRAQIFVRDLWVAHKEM